MKQRKQVTLSSLHKLLLLREGSPLAMLANVAHSDIFTHYRFHVSENQPFHRTRLKTTTFTIVSFIMLLLFQPVADLLSVVIILETDSTHTLGDVAFGGVRLGITSTPIPFETWNCYSEVCIAAPLTLFRHEKAVSEYTMCSSIQGIHASVHKDASINIFEMGKHALGFELVLDGKATYYGKNAFMLTTGSNEEKNTFQIPLRTSLTAVEQLIDVGMSMLSEVCGQENITTVMPNNILGGNSTKMLMAKIMYCPAVKDAEKMTTLVRNALLKRIGFVAADEMLVFPVTYDAFAYGNNWEPELLEASTFPLFVRRRQNIGLGLLGEYY